MVYRLSRQLIAVITIVVQEWVDLLSTTANICANDAKVISVKAIIPGSLVVGLIRASFASWLKVFHVRTL